MSTPDVTRAQLGSLLAFVGGQLVAWHVMSASTSQLAVAIASTAIAAAWTIADAVIRHGRSHVAAAQAVSALVLEQQASSGSSG